MRHVILYVYNHCVVRTKNKNIKRKRHLSFSVADEQKPFARNSGTFQHLPAFSKLYVVPSCRSFYILKHFFKRRRWCQFFTYYLYLKCSGNIRNICGKWEGGFCVVNQNLHSGVFVLFVFHYTVSMEDSVLTTYTWKANQLFYRFPGISRGMSAK